MAAACDFALVFHGAIVLLLSQFAGYAFFRAINRPDEAAAKSGMWRMSHAACSAGAILLIALGPVVPHLRLGSLVAALLVDSLIGSTYALCIGTIVAAISGQRGTRPRMPPSNLVVYGLYLVGALGSTIAGLVLLYGAARAHLD